MKTGILYVMLFVYALMDAQTVVNGAIDGLHLAITVVIPSLFPFIFLCTLCSNHILGTESPVLHPLEKLCGMPKGSGNLLILGLCGGYPVGAQCVASAHKQGAISKQDAERLLGFCNNAGPSFIFGMIGSILKDIRLCWLLWLSQIISSILVGITLPNKSKASCSLQRRKSNSITEAMDNTIHICSKIAGWVILFRAVLSVLDKWFLSSLPEHNGTVIAGLLELSNGCVRLQYVNMPMLQFILCGTILTFGGICVHLQTKSVTNSLSARYYLLGKILQTLFVLPILFILWKISVAF